MSHRFLAPLLAGMAGSILGCNSSDSTPSDWRDARDSTGFRTLVESPTICRDCIVLERVAVLGDTAGPGYIEWTQNVTRDSLGNYWVGQRDGPKVFDSAGNFLRQVGRAGQGPMEFRRIVRMHTDRDGRVHILDSDNIRETVVGPDFQLYEENRIFGFGSYPASAPLPGRERYVLNMFHMTADRGGLPLHVVEGSEILYSFGEPIDEASPRLSQNKARRRVAADRSGYIFSAEYLEFGVEAWTGTGRRVTGFVGPKLAEEKPVSGPLSAERPPPSMLMAIQPDEAQRLWVVSSGPRDDWLENFRDVERPNGRVGLEPIDDDPRATYIVRIDVIDLDRALIIASSERNELIGAFIGDGLGLEIRYTEIGIPQAFVWSLALKEPR